MKKLSKPEREEFDKLKQMAERYITSSHKIVGSAIQRWSKRSLKWLKKNYANTDYPNRFLLVQAPNYNSRGGLSSTDVNRIQRKLSVLLETQKDKQPEKGIRNNLKISRKVFIVHGRNNSLKEEVARFITNIGLKPIILHEQPNKGRTIIEKFIDYSEVEFAIVLLTADDKGCSISGDINELKDRARQNVIFELGFFIGKLGRDKVCALYIPGVELPSDYSGVLFIEIDNPGNWKFNLAKEIRSSGIKIDISNII